MVVIAILGKPSPPSKQLLYFKNKEINLMIVGSIKEDLTLEIKLRRYNSRNSKKYNRPWIKTVCVEKNYATHLGINDNEYKDLGVEIKNNSNFFKFKKVI